MTRLMLKRIVLIVEGQSEAKALPSFVRRILHDREVFDIEVDGNPIREPRSRLIRPENLAKRIQQAALRPGAAGILVLFDADDDAACKLAPKLQASVRSAVSIPLRLVMAVRETEAWLLGGVESLRAARGVKADASFAGNPEMNRGAKERLSRLMSSPYKEAVHLGPLLMKLAYENARRRAPSLDKFLRDLESLVESCRPRRRI